MTGEVAEWPATWPTKACEAKSRRVTRGGSLYRYALLPKAKEETRRRSAPTGPGSP
jgi:hypothetical protein